MTTYNFIMLLFAISVLLIVSTYLIAYFLIEKIKSKRAARQRTRYYHHCRHNQLVIEKRDFFGCYLISLGVSHVFLP